MMRLKIALIVITLAFLGVIGRLFYIQIVKHEYYAIKAEGQQLDEITVPAERGRIFASGGTLVSNEEAYSVNANPQEVDGKKIAGKLAEILLEDNRFFSYNSVPKDTKDPEKYLTEKIEELLSRKESRGVRLARKVPVRLVQKIKAAGWEGFWFVTDPRRFYPEGTLASSILGLVAEGEDGIDHGYNGIEGNYDGDLRGRDGKIIQVKSNEQNPLLMAGSSEQEVKNGSDLYLTIDRGLQAILTAEVKKGVEHYGAKTGSFVVLESKTGRILAMGNYPNFDPGNFNPYIPPGSNPKKYKKESRNLAVSSVYEPGSVMKPLTIASGLDAGKIKPNWKFNDDGPLYLGITKINTWDGKHFGKDQTLAQLLQKSNNVGAAKLALDIGAGTLRSYFLNFGFGSQLKVDLEGEEAGLVKAKRDWHQVDLANAGFGQGISVTPLQMAAAYAALANGGVLMKPYVVEKLVEPGGREVKFDPQPIRRVISKDTSSKVIDLLRQAVEGGESRALRETHYRISGKTGTAEIAIGGKYSLDKTNTTFVGFPYKDKSFVMIIRLEEPTSSTFSATTVVPLWVSAFEKIAPLFGILPDR